MSADKVLAFLSCMFSSTYDSPAYTFFEVNLIVNVFSVLYIHCVPITLFCVLQGIVFYMLFRSVM